MDVPHVPVPCSGAASRAVNWAAVYEGRIKNTEIWKMRRDMRRAAEIRPESRRKRGKVTARTLHGHDIEFRSVICFSRRR